VHDRGGQKEVCPFEGGVGGTWQEGEREGKGEGEGTSIWTTNVPTRRRGGGGNI